MRARGLKLLDPEINSGLQEVILHEASGGNHQGCGRIVIPEPFDNAQGSVLSDIERLSKPQHLYWGVEGLTF